MLIAPVVKPLQTADWPCLTKLFATSAGVDGCWCMWPRRARGAHEPGREANRSAMRTLLDSGESPGLIAFTGDEPVGWCAVGPRSQYPQYEALSGGRIWAIPCLYVAPSADRRPVASVLIEAASALARDNGATSIVGPPPYWDAGDAAAVARVRADFLESGFDEASTTARMPRFSRVLRPDR